MKITVGDVTNSRANVRDYLSVSDENGRIYVKYEAMHKVLIDRSAEWEELTLENTRLREVLHFYANGENGEKARQALKGESK